MALILSAVDENLAEDGTEKTPAAYFVSFLSLLEQCVSETEITDKTLANSVVYLLNLVAPYVSEGLLRSKFSVILSRLALVLSNSESDAPLLKSSIGVLEIALIAQDLSSWSLPTTQMSAKRAMIGLLTLGLDPRPKVRKRAQDAISQVLKNPPPGPKFEHPAAELCSDVALQSLQSNSSKKRASNSGTTENSNVKVIHNLQLIKAISNANGWSSDKAEELCEHLLNISRTADQYLVVAVFEVFEAVFHSITDEVDAPKLIKILDAIFDLTPSTKDQHLAPAWLAVVAQAMSSYATVQPMKAFNRLPKIFEILSGFLENGIAENIHISAAECLVALVHTAIPDEALKMEKNKSGLTPTESSELVLKKVGELAFELTGITRREAWAQIVPVLAACFDRLRWRSDPHLINIVKVTGALRPNDGYSGDLEGCDKIIGSAIRALGPEKVLELLPMTLVSNDDKPATRAWLLPLLRDNIQHARLGHFRSYFVPLTEKINIKIEGLEDIIASDPNSKVAPVQVKIYQAIYDQIWSLLPKYLDLPNDLQSSFDQSFAEFLSNSLYQYVELRPLICQALKLVVDSNVAYADGAVEDDVLLIQRFPVSKASKNVSYLRDNFASKMLSVLFNVFSQTPSESRGYILETIIVYLEIASPEDLDSTFNKVSSVLHEGLSSSNFTLANTMLDLVVAMAQFLPTKSHNTLLTIFNTVAPLQDQAQLQKKAFRIIHKLALTEDGKATIGKYMDNLEKLFIDLTDKVTAPSRGPRLQAMFPIVDELPDSDLHFIPAILSETVLATKDVNEKTRTAAFDLLIHLALRMQRGGVVDMSKVYGEEAQSINASLEEFFTMVAAGLVGTTPHMISATITALSRILFEFRNDISEQLLQELSSTVEMFLTSKNREIVKSTLGFVKITVVSLPKEIVEPNLKELVEHLLVWSHEHASHLKMKVKHIIERLVRQFGYDRIAGIFPEEDMKLLINIRKTRDRAKRKGKEDGDDKEQNSKESRKFANEFDQAVYGSDSDDSDSEPEEEEKPQRGRKQKQRGDRFIVENDEPLDLLDSSALAKISSSKPGSKKHQSDPKLKNKYSQDMDGKIVVKDDKADELDEAALSGKNAIAEYITAVKNGPVRGQRNRLKYKRARKFQDASDDEGDYEDDFRPSKKPSTPSSGKGQGAPRKKMRPMKKKL